MGCVLGKAKLLRDNNCYSSSLLIAEQGKIAILRRGYVWGRFASWEGVEQLPLATWSVEQVNRICPKPAFASRERGISWRNGTDSIAHYWQHMWMRGSTLMKMTRNTK